LGEAWGDVAVTYARKEIIGNATLYLGDCLEILPTLPKVDAVITDPPYGISYVHGHEKSKHASVHNEVPVVGDENPFDPAPFLSLAPLCVLWGANHFARRLPESGRWIVWDKRVGTVQNDQSDLEVAWCSSLTTDRMIWHMWNGFSKDSERNVPRDHPTQKPVYVMVRCIELAKVPAAAIVLDPFFGSGTTGVACMNLGRKFIGIEIEPKYFDIACQRIENAQRQERLFA
jgi:site-specific DNA-methyltransferase (adenine-specific)/modification methylase